jgi:SAM-dependent methyltransferase
MTNIRKIIEALSVETKSKTHLDLGSGSSPRNPFNLRKALSIDTGNFEHQGFVRVEFGQSLPFSNSSIASVSAFDFLEHIPRTGDSGPTSNFVNYMEEIYRVLEPGGVFLAATPGYPRKSVFSDPTHVNYITIDTHKYFTGEVLARKLHYGFTGGFENVRCQWILPTHKTFRRSQKVNLHEELKRQLHQILYFLKCILTLSNPYTHILWVLKKSK